MIDALHISENSLKTTQQWINTISGNIANMQTPAYKKTDVNFVEMISAPITDAQELTSDNVQSNILGAQIGSTTVNFNQGQIKQTGNPMDVAINGGGFLEVTLPDGSLGYTRLGKLKLSADGDLALIDGSKLSSSISVPSNATKVMIAENGKLTAELDGGKEVVELGELALANIPSPEYLSHVGGGIYKVTPNSGDAVVGPAGQNGTGTIAQGYIEGANVDLIEEMSSLMVAQRAYQINARLLQVTDQVMETINNLRR